MLLFDLGFGNVRRLQRLGIDPADVSDVFITHRHPDHVGDLAALLFHFRYEVKPRSGRLRLWGPEGFEPFVLRLMAAHKPWCDVRGYDLELGAAPCARDGWTADALAVPHPTAAAAYRLSYKGKSFVYSGDTGFCPALADFAADADLFLIECAASRAQHFEGHLTPELALATLEASGCKRGLLTHIGEGADRDLKRMKLGRFRVARDGQEIRL